MRSNARRTAFTLVELLVVIAIIGVLIALLLPAIQKVRGVAQRLVCTNNLKQLGVAAHNYHSTYGHFTNQDGSNGQKIETWTTALFPYLERNDLYDTLTPNDINYAALWHFGTDPQAILATVIKGMICPADPFQSPVYKWSSTISSFAGKGYAGMNSYGCNVGTGTFDPATMADPTSGAGAHPDGVILALGHSPVRIQDIKDGTSSTILYCEQTVNEPMWAQFVKLTDTTDGNQYPDRLDAYSEWVGLNKFSLKYVAVQVNYRLPIMDYSTVVYPGPQFESLYAYRVQGAYGSMHSGGANFAFADGSVRFLGNSISLATLTALATRAGGEIIDEDY